LALLALPACSSKAPSDYRIGILRVVPGVAAENSLYAGLAEGGIPRDRVKVIGGKALTEAHPTPLDAAAAVKGWTKSGVDAVVALSTSAAQVAKDAATAVPVLSLSNDPKATGLLRNERHPEGHVTGVTYRVPADRTLALISDAYPGARNIGCLYPPADEAAVPGQANLARAAENLGLTLTCATFTAPADAPDAARSLLDKGVGAVVLVSSPTTSRSVAAIFGALGAAKVPVIANTPTPGAELVLAPDAAALYVDLGRQLARVLRGAKVADVPVQDPGHFLLVVDTVVATRNGHTIPKNVLDEATQVVR
jgi:putative ABC transport system substrate-binding protein